jgi:hypothetical protein
MGTMINEPGLAKLLRWLIYISALVPLVIFSQYMSPFHFGKVIVLRSIVQVMVVLYLLLIWRDRSYLPKSHPILWAFVAFTVAFTITSVTSIAPISQNEEFATHCGKMTKADGEINPNGNPIENDRKFRAYFVWPGTYFFIEKNNKKSRIIVKDAAFLNGKFLIKRVLPEGKKEISYEEFLRNT